MATLLTLPLMELFDVRAVLVIPALFIFLMIPQLTIALIYTILDLTKDRFSRGLMVYWFTAIVSLYYLFTKRGNSDEAVDTRLQFISITIIYFFIYFFIRFIRSQVKEYDRDTPNTTINN